MVKNIKKIIRVLCGATFCTAITVSMPQMAEAAEVTINETNFPDKAFREYVTSEFDKDKNGKLSDVEIAGVTEINVSFVEADVFHKIENLAGVEYFTALQSLNCEYNNLKELNVSKNTALESLQCSGNKLTKLDVSKNTVLKSLECSYNELTKLDVSKNTVLESLSCSSDYGLDNNLIELDVSKNTALKSLDCFLQRLTKLDVSKNIALESLNCGDNELAELDLSKNTVLKSLSCGDNKLTELDLSKNIILESLNCSSDYYHDGNLTKLDISKNTALTYLDCSNNELTELDLSKNTALESLNCGGNQLPELDLSKNIALTSLECGGNELTELDLNTNILLAYLRCSGIPLLKLNSQTYDKSLLTTFDLIGQGDINVSDIQNIDMENFQVIDITKPASFKVEGEEITIIYTDTVIFQTQTPVPSTSPDVVVINEVNFPDAIFRDYVSSKFDRDKNGKLSKEEIAKATNIRVYKRGIKSLKGVEYCTALKSLECSGNELIVLDLSKNTALTDLDCSDNELTKLDLSKNIVLEYLSCYRNSMTELKLNSQTYDTYDKNDITYGKLSLLKYNLHSLSESLSDLQNVIVTEDKIKVTDITKPATYKVDGKDFTIIYVDTKTSTSPLPTANPTSSPIRTSSPIILLPATYTPAPTITPVPSFTPIPTVLPTPIVTAQPPTQTPVATATPVASADVTINTVKPVNTAKPVNTQTPTAAPTAKPVSTSRPLSTIQRNKALLNEMKVSKKMSMKKGKSKKVKLSLPDDVTVVKKFSGKDGEVQVAYYTSDTGVATINKNGKIKAKKKGSVSITTVVTFENKMAKAFSTEVKVKKNKKTKSIVVKKNSKN